MSTPNKTEEKRATAVIELAKELLGPAILAQGPLPATSTQDQAIAYFDRSVNIAISLAGLFRKKSIALIEQARTMDEKTNTD